MKYLNVLGLQKIKTIDAILNLLLNMTETGLFSTYVYFQFKSILKFLCYYNKD